MTSLKWLGLAAGHSASDTIRPFLITMARVWAVAIAGATVLLRARRNRSGG
jgi:hypothetical protein